MLRLRPAKRPMAPGVALRVACGVLERLPGDLEEDAVLRVHELRLAGVDAEEGGVEEIDVVDDRAGADEIGIARRARRGRGRRGGNLRRKRSGSIRRRRRGFARIERYCGRRGNGRRGR